MLPRRLWGSVDQETMPWFELQGSASSEESLRKAQKAQ
jgi:hypothetical protein